MGNTHHKSRPCPSSSHSNPVRMLLSIDLSILEDTDLTLSIYWTPFWGIRTAINICKKCAAIEICKKCAAINPSGSFCLHLNLCSVPLRTEGTELELVVMSRFSKEAAEEFISTVVSWRIEDIRQNESIFESMIQQIPDEFPDLRTYCNAFRLHILEEMRSTLKKEIDEKDFSMSCDVVFTKQKVGSTITLKQSESILSPQLGLFYRQSRSQSLSEDSMSFLAKVQRKKSEPIGENEFDYVWLVEFTYAPSSASNDFEQSLGEDGSSPHWNLALLEAPLTPSARICNALSNMSASHACGIQKVLLTSLAGAPAGADAADAADSAPLSPLADALNDSQRIAIRRCVRAYGARPSALQVVHGPPGTGKTSTLVALLGTLLTASGGPARRAWVAAPTNQAVCELARRACRDLVHGPPAAGVEPYDLVLIGDEGRLVLDRDLRLLHLDSRVRRLAKAQAGWSAGLAAVVAFDPSAPDPPPAADQADQAAQGPSGEADPEQVLRDACSDCIQSAEVLAAELPPAALPAAGRQFMREAVGALARFLCEHKSISESGSVPKQRQIALVGEAHARLVGALRQRAGGGAPPPSLSQARLRELVLKGARALFSTVSAAGSTELQLLKHEHEDFTVDLAIVDEATQLVEASTAIMLSPRLGCLVLAGDHKQLPPTVISGLAQRHGYGRSLFDRLLGNPGSASSLLNVQYRMHPRISGWPNRRFYNGSLLDGPNVLSRDYVKPWHEFFPPVSVFSVRGKEESAATGSKFNALEVEVAVKLLKAFYRLFAKDADRTIKVGLLSPYSAQRELLARQVSDAKGQWSASKLTVEVNTVDGFQGQECDIVMFLAVRCNTKGMLGFLTDVRRLNVAVTRARFSLVVICDDETLKSNSVWRSFLDEVESDNKLFSSQNNDLLKRALQSCKREASLDFAGCKWADKVSFVTNFMIAFKLKNESERRQILSELLRISDGKWPKVTRSASLNSDLEGIIFVLSFRAINIIFSVDLQSHVSPSNRSLRDYSQIIMVWDCVTSDKVRRILHRICERYRLRSSMWLDMCRRRDPAGVPLYWPGLEPFDHNAQPTTMAAIPVVQEEVVHSLALVKSYALNTLHARILMGSSELSHVELPHNVSAEEEFLINFVGSLFVIGRSGTGNLIFPQREWNTFYISILSALMILCVNEFDLMCSI
jgi:hypothetical protein